MGKNPRYYNVIDVELKNVARVNISPYESIVYIGKGKESYFCRQYPYKMERMIFFMRWISMIH